jgi:hypothetical protein
LKTIMADTKKQRTTRKRIFSSDAEVLTMGTSRQRRLRRIGSSHVEKPLPVITPRPRREQTATQPVKLRRVKHATNSRTGTPGMPPVMARGGMESMAARKPKRGQPKRRFDIPLGALVADAAFSEVRLPALPRFQVGWRAVSGMMALMMVACLVFIWQSPAFHISDIQATGLQRLNLADVSSVLGVTGDSIFTADSQALEASLQAAFPELTQIKVKVSLPGKLEIMAVERQPVLAWMQGDAELWVDAEGVSFQPRGDASADLVTVKAQSAPPGTQTVQADESTTPLVDVATVTPQFQLSPELVATILSLNTVAPQGTQLLYNAEHGLGWKDKQYGWKVFFGAETQDIEQKLIVYQALAARLRAEGIQPSLVSVEFLHAPYYQLDN